MLRARLWLLLLALPLALPLAGCPSSSPTGDDDDDSVVDDDDDSVDDDDDDSVGDDDDDSAGDDDDDDDSAPLPGCIGQANGEPFGPSGCAELAACVIQGQDTNWYAGFGLASGGDFDGDGLVDLAVGAPGAERSAELRDEGRLEIHSARSLSEDGGLPLAWVPGGQLGASAGGVLSFLGDIDNDGFDDLAIGATGVGAEGQGAIYLLRGRDPSDLDSELAFDVTLAGAEPWARVGTAITGLGDVNGDGFDDFALADEQAQNPSGNEYPAGGAVRIFYGRATWPATLSSADADLTFRTAAPIAGFGHALSGGRDVTGDGQPDLLIGAPYFNGYRGQVLLLDHSDLIRETGDYPAEGIASTLSEGLEFYDNLGLTLTAAPDLDDDGIDDVVIGVPLSDGHYNGAGEVQLLAGGSDLRTAPRLIGRIYGEWDDHQLGIALAAGDVDGDGRGDLLLGANEASQGIEARSGRSYLLTAAAHDWSSLFDASESGVAISGAAAHDRLGNRVALGDWNGDGHDDLALGAPYHDVSDDEGGVYLYWGE